MNFFDEYYKTSLKIRSQAARSEYITAIVDYYYTGDEPEFKHETADVAFTAIRYSLDKSRRNALNRRNETGTNEEGNANETGTNEEGNANETGTGSIPVPVSSGEKEKEKERGKVSPNGETPPKPPTQLVRDVVAYLNERTGSCFKPTTARTASAIEARASEGYALDDFKAVIDCKADEWGSDAKMRRFLRPETLFRPQKFEAYVNEAKREEVAHGRFAEYAD